VQFAIAPGLADGIEAQVTELTAGVREDDIPTWADGFDLAPYLSQDPSAPTEAGKGQMLQRVDPERTRHP
jgi:hypothetical protein